MTEARDQRALRVAVAGLVFALVGPLTYTLLRVYDWARGHDGDPRMILRTLHTAYYWRVAISLWWAIAVAALVAWQLGRIEAREKGVARGVAMAAMVLVPLLVLFHFAVP